MYNKTVLAGSLALSLVVNQKEEGDGGSPNSEDDDGHTSSRCGTCTTRPKLRAMAQSRRRSQAAMLLLLPLAALVCCFSVSVLDLRSLQQQPQHGAPWQQQQLEHPGESMTDRSASENSEHTSRMLEEAPSMVVLPDSDIQRLTAAVAAVERGEAQEEDVIGLIDFDALKSSESSIKKRYHAYSRIVHPDKLKFGASPRLMMALNAAKDQALATLRRRAAPADARSTTDDSATAAATTEMFQEDPKTAGQMTAKEERGARARRFLSSAAADAFFRATMILLRACWHAFISTLEEQILPLLLLLFLMRSLWWAMRTKTPRWILGRDQRAPTNAPIISLGLLVSSCFISTADAVRDAREWNAGQHGQGNSSNGGRWEVRKNKTPGPKPLPMLAQPPPPPQQKDGPPRDQTGVPIIAVTTNSKEMARGNFAPKKSRRRLTTTSVSTEAELSAAIGTDNMIKLQKM